MEFFAINNNNYIVYVSPAANLYQLGNLCAKIYTSSLTSHHGCTSYAASYLSKAK